MRASSQNLSFVGGLLLTVAMVCTPCNATEAGAGLPEGFLEYLATLVDQEGEWVDALELNESASPEGDPQQTVELEKIDDLASSSNGSSADDEVEE